MQEKLRDLITMFPAVVILGARQTEKTTLAQSIGQDWTYLDLENTRHLDRISRDPDLFFSQYSENLIIDEPQPCSSVWYSLHSDSLP